PGAAARGSPSGSPCGWRPPVLATWSPVRIVESPPHPRVLRRVGIPGRAAIDDGLGSELEVPRLVGVDLAEAVASLPIRRPSPGLGAGRRALPLDQLPHRRDDLGSELPREIVVVASDEHRRDAVTEGEIG